MISVSETRKHSGTPGLIVLLLLGVVLSSSTAGCGAAQPQIRGPDDDTLSLEESRKLLTRADDSWEGRLDKGALEAAIETYRRVAGARPDADETGESRDDWTRAELWTRVARAYQFRADAHLSDAATEDVRDNHAKGMDAAKRAIKAAAPALADTFEGDKSLADALENSSGLPSSASPGLYWYAVHLGQWGQTRGVFTLMKYRADIEAAMNFVRDNRPEYFYGACFRYFGTYWTRLPMGKKPDRSRKSFDRAIDIAPSFLASKVLKAEHYATLAGDRKLFERLLQEVLQADLDTAPSIRPENTIAKRQAEKLLERADELF